MTIGKDRLRIYLGLVSADLADLADILVEGIPGLDSYYIQHTTSGGDDVIAIEACGGGSSICTSLYVNGQVDVHLEIDLLIIDPKKRGLGYGSKLVRAIKDVLEDHVRNTGCRAVITLTAGLDDGGYFWAAQGFIPSDPDALRSDIVDKIEELKNQGVFIPEEVGSLFDGGKPLCLAGFIRAYPLLAKRILSGLWWEGSYTV